MRCFPEDTSSLLALDDVTDEENAMQGGGSGVEKREQDDGTSCGESYE